MKKVLLLLLLWSCGLPAAESIIKEDRLPIADPYVLYWQGKYYAYGTNVNGFEVYVSTDLKRWTRNDQLALSPDDSWGDRWFWAPEVYYIASKQKFYMFYSVDEHICVATADSPEGPFQQDVKKPIVEGEKGIDTTLFIDDDGTPYLFYVRFTAGNVIWVARMNDDLQSIQPQTLTQCIAPTEPWELKQARVAEGPSVLKHNGTYYLLYSANDYQSKDYAVGYATASSPFGPWKKYSGNPILSRQLEPAASAGLVGTGHGAPFLRKDGSYMYIFHAHWNAERVQPRTSYIAHMQFDKDGIIHMTGKLIRPVVVEAKR
jgi:beta-xylosidase